MMDSIVSLSVKNSDVIITTDDDKSKVFTKTSRLQGVSYVLPHPAKISWGGEDAVFIAHKTFGVFDGVSGAEKEKGVPLYSQTLANEMQRIINEQQGTIMVNEQNSSNNDNSSDSIVTEKTNDNNIYKNNNVQLQQLTTQLLMAAEIADETATGASTAIVGCVSDDGLLNVLNVGDSTCIVVRLNNSNCNNMTTTNDDAGGTNIFEIVAETEDISHYFECPYQLSVDSPDRPRDGTKLKKFQLQRNDIIFMASDGIFDNLFTNEIASIIATIMVEGNTVKEDVVEAISTETETTESVQDQSQQPQNDEIESSKILLQKVAETVSLRARTVSLMEIYSANDSNNDDDDNTDPEVIGPITPYAQACQQYNDPDFAYGVGGKVDDISCVVLQYY
jgi:protein phosphatase PTC7